MSDPYSLPQSGKWDHRGTPKNQEILRLWFNRSSHIQDRWRKEGNGNKKIISLKKHVWQSDPSNALSYSGKRPSHAQQWVWHVHFKTAIKMVRKERIWLLKRASERALVLNQVPKLLLQRCNYSVTETVISPAPRTRNHGKINLKRSMHTRGLARKLLDTKKS